MKVIITKGIPAAGKSTWAKEAIRNGNGKWKHINKDTLRLMIDFEQYSKPREAFVKKARDVLLETMLEGGFNVIVDDTNLHPSHETKVREIAEKYGAEVEVKWFPITLEAAIERDKRREAKVGESVINLHYQHYIEAGGPEPSDECVVPEAPVYDVNLPNCIIIDLDGTLANFEGKRGPYEGEKCSDDDVNDPVFAVLNHFKVDHDIVLLSGRESKFRPQTLEFLWKNNIHFDHLFMRKSKDLRNDAVIKRELYEANINGKLNVRFILDDRNRVVDMFRSLGIPCFQVNYGKF